MRKQIIRRKYSEELAATFTNVPPLLRRIYASRSVQSNNELNKELTALLPYHSLSNIEQAAELLADAIMHARTILIVGDFDADGATSTTVAMRALKSFGASHIHYLVPNRFAYGYGLTPELVQVAKDFSPSLIVTVDNGIANHAGVLAAKKLGMHVIITDHHLAASTLPPADAIVNPNQPQDNFPSKHLAGVGVIFYVMLALRRKLIERDWFSKKKLPQPNMSKLLDLVALGTVADLAQLDYNNRILVHQGLRRIRAGQCIPGIVALLELSNRDFSRTTATDLGFAVAARLNAAGRLDDMSLGIECLLCDDVNKARAIARQLDQLNNERRSIEQDMQMQALKVINNLNENLQGQLPYGLCLFDESWHQGVIGILASRIKDRFHRPVIVFAPGQDGELKGSARSINGLHIRDALAHIDTQYPQLIRKFGGHAMAAGLTIAREVLDNFIKIFNDVVSGKLTTAQLQHLLMTDGELETHEMTADAVTLIRDAGPWGQAFPEPLFDDSFQLLDQRIVGDKHLKLTLKKNNMVLEAIAFFVNLEEWPNYRCQSLRAVYRLDLNEYKGRRNIQLIIEYLEPFNEI